jgi:hypothetical protein
MAGVPAPPSNLQPYIQQAAQGTGLPVNVVQAQVYKESKYNTGAVSPTGAEGFWQFEPATYNAVASQAGVSPGSEFNVADETKAYITFMNQLLQQEGGDIFKALEAYNAGPGNLQAGASYASSIMSAAGVAQGAKAGSPTTQATLTGISIPNPFSWLFGGPIAQGAQNAISGLLGQFFQAFLQAFGVSSIKDMFQRLGLILLGVALILVGLNLLSKSSAFSMVPTPSPSSSAEGETAASAESTELAMGERAALVA